MSACFVHVWAGEGSEYLLEWGTRSPRLCACGVCVCVCVCVCVKIELERLTGQNLALAFESRLSFFLAENQIFIYLK